jgi:hypothetical protein
MRWVGSLKSKVYEHFMSFVFAQLGAAFQQCVQIGC